LELCFDPKLKPYLLQLKSQFTAYNLATVLPMRSAYSIRLYELLIQYASIGSRIFDLSELRDLLGVPGTYRLQDLRRRILDKATEEINQYGAFTVSYALVKEGRSYSSVRFSIVKKPKKGKETLKEYIARVRATCANKTLSRTKDKQTNKEIELSVSAKGYLYNKLDLAWRPNKKRALQIWKDLQRLGICS
jgi:plasmid replication initiation protein